MSSRSATVLVIFIVAVIAFCFASVFAAMTGPISILPVENETGVLLENLSISDDSSNNVYTYQDNSHSDDSSDDSNVETTTDSSQSSSNQKDNSHQDTPSPTPTPTPTPSTDDSGSHEGGDSSIETTTG